MITRRAFAALPLAVCMKAQESQVDFLCPMDPDVHSKLPGKCPRCGMKLEAGLPEPVEYPMQLTMQPKAPMVGQPAILEFQVFEPVKRQPVTKFLEIHEKLFHLFVVSSDLKFFVHEHPELGAGGVFRLKQTFPQAGEYRLLADFFPQGGTPQLISRSIFVQGKKEPSKPVELDLRPQEGSTVVLARELSSVQRASRSVRGRAMVHPWARSRACERRRS